MGLKEEREEIKKIEELSFYDCEITRENNKKIPLVKINHKNVIFVEKMIAYNSMYGGTMNEEYYRKADKKLKDSLGLEEDEIKDIVIDIDNSNSTHINSDNMGRICIPRKIHKMQEAKSLKELLSDKEEEYELIKKIYEPNELTEKEIEDIKEKKGKDVKFKKNRNISFATKFCHYMTIKLTDTFNIEEQDKYSIYDSFLAKAIPLYIDYFSQKYENFKNFFTDKEYKDLFRTEKGYKILDLKIEKYADIGERYRKYQEIIDYIIDYASKIENDGYKISRNGFDHLLWYYYKGKI